MDSESEGFKFNLMGSGTIVVSELINSKEQHFLVETPSTRPLNGKIFFKQFLEMLIEVLLFQWDGLYPVLL